MDIDTGRLQAYYEGIIAAGVEAALSGKPAAFANSQTIQDLYDAEFLAGYGHVPSPQSQDILRQTRAARRAILGPRLYRNVLGNEHLDDIVERVDDPLLDSITSLLSSGPVSEDDFVAGFDKELTGTNLKTYLRSIVLLELIKQKPHLIDKLEADSSYLPHKLVLTRKKTYQEVTADMAQVLHDQFSPELIDAIEKCRVLIQPKPFIEKCGASKPSCYSANKKYQIPPVVPCTFTSTFTEEAMDALFAETDVKRDVYTALLRCFYNVWDVAIEDDKPNYVKRHAGSSSKNKKTEFAVNKVEYAAASRAIAAYAKNQLISAWQAGTPRPRSMLSSLLHMTAQEEGNTLAINHRGAKYVFTRDAYFNNTTIDLPTCMAILTRFYDVSTRLLGSGSNPTS